MAKEAKLLRIVVPKYPYANIFSFLVMPPLGPLFVCASVRQELGWRVEIIDENNYRGRLDHFELQKQHPADVVGFYGGLTSITPRLYELAKLYKAMGVFTIAGGGHVSALPQDALANGVDVVVLGEGEHSVPELLSAWSGNSSLLSIDGLAILRDGRPFITGRRPPIKDLGSLPHPDFDILFNPRKPLRFAPICHSRGCIYRCEFCSVNMMLGPPRLAPTEHTLENFKNLLKKGFRGFFFVDDNFVCKRDKTIELCEGISRISSAYGVKPSITVQVRLDIADDDELLKVFKRAGVRVLCLGLESPIEEELKKMKKSISAQAMGRQITRLRREGFFLHGMFIFGYPFELEELALPLPNYIHQAKLFMDFIRRTGIDTIQVLKAVPVPGTRLFKRLKDAGRLLPLDKMNWDKYDGNFLTFLPERGKLIELQETATLIMRKFYSRINALKLALTVLFAPLFVGWHAFFEWLRSFRREILQHSRTGAILARAISPSTHFRLILRSWKTALWNFYRMQRNYLLRWVGSKIVRRWICEVKKSKVLEVLRQIDEELGGAR